MSAAVSAISVRAAISAASSSRAWIPSRIARWSGSALRRERLGVVVRVNVARSTARRTPAQVLEELVVAREEDAAVEPEVRLEVCGLVVDPGLHARVRLRDAGDLLGRRARRGEPRRERLDRQPDLRRLLVEPLVVRRLAPPAEDVRVEDVPVRPRPDARPGLRLRLDEPLRGENADGLADDGAADREIRDELVLGRKGVARLERPGHDVHPDRVDDLAVQPAPRIRQWSAHARCRLIRAMVDVLRDVGASGLIIILYAF